jgi:hypothetical protein
MFGLLRNLLQTIHPSLKSLSLPPGYRVSEIDSKGHNCGVIVKKNGLLISYDIGTDSSVYWDSNQGGEILWFREEIISGNKARVALVKFDKGQNLLVTFDELNVSFNAWVANEQQQEEMLSIVRSYRAE